MKKHIKNNKTFFYSLFGLIALIVFCIIKFKELFIPYPDYSIIIWIVCIALILVYYIYRSAKWKIEYDEIGFTLSWEKNEKIEYNKIQAIIHYKAKFNKSRIDKFIIKYLGISEFGTAEEEQEITLSGYPHTIEMKNFFDFTRIQNPKIVYINQTVTRDGIEESNFDYFPD